MSIVTVLTPNGRRQNVKITPNTTLLQVLEEVCSKHGFKPEEYDIRHHNKILDVSAIFRFSGLPNNAQLEMTEAIKQRSESPVVLGLHLESGDRLTGEFTPSDNLWNVIMSLNPEEAKSFQSPVVIYMRKEVCGRENLEKTTLRSLGLTGGRAILRFFNKTPEELRTQANVSVVLSRTTVHNGKTNAKSLEVQSEEAGKSSSAPQNLPERHESISTRDKEKKTHAKRTSIHEKHDGHKESKETGQTESAKKLEASKVNKTEPPKNKSSSGTGNPNKGGSKEKESKTPVDMTPENGLQNDDETESLENKKIILLGERNAVAYNLNKIKPVVFEEVPDDFYDLTISDAKLLLRDAKQLCAELEDAPLMTSAQRELEKNKKILSLLNQYKKTVLRIKFPDRTVLQGTFSSVETISAVEKFVANYLENPNISFYLYTTPPKEILKSDWTLLESNCVPCAVLYFGVAPDIVESEHFLRSDVLKNFSSPSAAALTAYQSRGLNRKEGGIVEKKNNPKESTVSVAGPSSSESSAQATRTRTQESSPPFKVPKWFKIQK